MVNNPMCRFNMMLRGDDSDDGQFGHVSKETIWMTNAEEIAKELQGSVKTIFQEQNPIDISTSLMVAGKSCPGVCKGAPRQFSRVLKRQLP